MYWDPLTILLIALVLWLLGVPVVWLVILVVVLAVLDGGWRYRGYRGNRF